MRNFVITGSGGNLGKCLVPMLGEIGKIIPVHRDDLTPYKFKRLLKEIPQDSYLIHLAWPVSQPDYLSSKENIKILNISKEIMKLSVEYKNLRIVGIGSILELGAVRDAYDNSKPAPASIYAECKAELAAHLRNLNSENSIWLRVAYQVSGLDPDHKLFPHLLKNCNTTVHIKNLDSKLDFIHRLDVARAIKIIIEADEKITTDSLVVGCGRTITISEILREMNVQSVLEQSNTPPQFLLTHPQILHKLGWEPKFKDIEKLISIIRQEFFAKTQIR
jgi:nucleoside-diphosphate-sugar epimerase